MFKIKLRYYLSNHQYSAPILICLDPSYPKVLPIVKIDSLNEIVLNDKFPYYSEGENIDIKKIISTQDVVNMNSLLGGLRDAFSRVAPVKVASKELTEYFYLINYRKRNKCISVIRGVAPEILVSLNEAVNETKKDNV